MSYREHASPPALSVWLECVWEREAVDGRPVRVVPDGCIDLVWIENGGTQIVGANTTAFVVTSPPGTPDPAVSYKTPPATRRIIHRT